MPEVNYFWDEIEDNVVREYDENNNTVAQYTTEPTQYGSVLSQDRRGEIRHFHFDAQGDTTELTDESGGITDMRRYTAFGQGVQLTGTTSCNYGFAGQCGYQQIRNIALTYVRRRYYDWRSSRWLLLDALLFTEGPNLFTYASNSPVKWQDPSGNGLWSSICDIWSKLGGGGAAGTAYSLAECEAFCDDKTGVSVYWCKKMCLKMLEISGKITCESLIVRCKASILSVEPEFRKTRTEACLSLCLAMACGLNEAKCLDMITPNPVP